MANIRSAAKAARQAVKRTLVNKSRLARIRSSVRKVEEAIATGDQNAALKALKAVEPEIMRGAGHHVMHKNAASRKVSRLTRRVKALAAKPKAKA